MSSTATRSSGCSIHEMSCWSAHRIGRDIGPAGCGSISNGFGFPGRVFPVNPNRTEIWGAACYPDIASLPEPPDHLAIFVPKERLSQVLSPTASTMA